MPSATQDSSKAKTPLPKKLKTTTKPKAKPKTSLPANASASESPAATPSAFRVADDGLLDVSHYPEPQLAEIANNNAMNVPLLKLPFDIRVMIWAEVLGGKLLGIAPRHSRHMEQEESPLAFMFNFEIFWHPNIGASLQQTNFCTELWENPGQRLWPGPQIFWDFWSNPDHPRSRIGWLYDNLFSRLPWALAEHPASRRWPAFSMPMLRTCRAIYAEARLLPYQLNVFSCPGHDALLDFIRHLAKGQRQALRCIVDDSNGRKRELGMLGGLPGLQVVCVPAQKLRTWKHKDQYGGKTVRLIPY